MRRVFSVLFRPRSILLLLLLVTLLKGLAWSIIIPPWHAPDEQQHFLYGQSIERSLILRVKPPFWVSEEAKVLYDLIQMSTVRYEFQPFDLTDRAAIAEQIRLLDDPAIKRTYVYDEKEELVRIRRFTAFHPPLYYALLAAIQKPLEGASILVRLLANRWLSVALGLVTVALAYRVGRDLWPDRPGWALLLATLVSFQPMFTFMTASVSNQMMEIVLFSGCLWISLRVMHGGLNVWRALALGLLVALGLLTKISFLSVFFLLGLLGVWHVVQLRRERRLGWRALWPWVLVFLLPLLCSGWWYAGTLLSGGGTQLVSYGASTAGAPVRLLPYLVHYGWVTIYQSVLQMYWGDFGWLDTPLPYSLRGILIVMTVLVVWTAGWAMVGQLTSRAKPGAARTGQWAWPLFVGACATLGYLAFYTLLDFRSMQDAGTSFGIQGRYFLPPVIGQMAWVMVGMTLPVPQRLRWAWAWLVGAGMIALNVYALFGVILPRYYGPGSLPVLLERATVLQPVTVATLVPICGAYAVLTAALVLALGGLLVQDQGDEL